MKTATVTNLAIVTIGLIVALGSPVDAAHEIDRVTETVVDHATIASTGLRLTTDILLRASATPNAAGFTRTAYRSTTTMRRPRTTVPRRIDVKRRRVQPRFKHTRDDTGANAPAPLDCRIESHPDCPRPTTNDSIFIDLGYPVQ